VVLRVGCTILRRSIRPRSVVVDPFDVGRVEVLRGPQPGKDPDIMKALAKRGAFVGIDRVRGDAGADLDRVALVLGFLEAGYVDRLLLSSDTRKDFGRVARFFAQLQAAGVSDAMRRTILVDNPRRFLAFVPKTG
jgi:predicted metal-dependent phosphotriesterase family hydrolase